MEEKVAHTIPKHILTISDLTFALPNDFSGDFEDAVMLFLEYRRSHEKLKVKDSGNKYSSTELLIARDSPNVRCCGAYGLLHLDKCGNYVAENDDIVDSD